MSQSISIADRWTYITCTPGNTAQPVCQAILHLFARSYYTTCTQCATSVYTKSHPTTFTLGATTPPARRVTLNNLFTRWHYITCMPGYTAKTGHQCHCSAHQVTSHKLYTRFDHTTCAFGAFEKSVHQVTLHNLYARCHCTSCTPGHTKQPVHQDTPHNLPLQNLYARSHYTICTLCHTAQPVSQVTLHNYTSFIHMLSISTAHLFNGI